MLSTAMEPIITFSTNTQKPVQLLHGLLRCRV